MKKSLMLRLFQILLIFTLTFGSIIFVNTGYATNSLPRIKTCSGSPAYFCNSSSIAFNPAGMNYTQTKTITWQTLDKDDNQTSTTYESHTPLLVNGFNLTKTQNDLAQMHNDGYNFIRIFINNEGYGTDSIGNPYYGIGGPRDVTATSNHINGLYKPYMDNFIALLRAANSKNMYVIPTLTWLPDNSYYHLTKSQKPKDSIGNFYIDDVNLLFMAQPWIDAKKSYITNFMNYVKNVDPNLLSTMLSVDFQNEVNLVIGAPPFTRTDTVPTSDGNSYNMSSDTQRQQAVDANVVNWSNNMMIALHAADSNALGTASVFTFNAIGLPGPNGVHSDTNNSYGLYPARPDTLQLYSTLSYIDIHAYPNNTHYNSPYNLNNDLNSSQFNNINQSLKPLFLGEFGAYTNYYSNLTSAAYGMKDYKNALVQKGFRAWGFYTWDSNQTGIYNAVETSGAINGQLAPTVWGF